MIVVTTPTGQIGAQVAKDLLDAGEPVRVIARDPDRLAEAVRQGAEVIQGSHGDAAVLDRALEGADALFWIVPPDQGAPDVEAAYVGFTRPAVEAIRRHGVGYVVAVTALGRGTRWQDSAGLVSVSLRMVDLLATSGAATRGLANPSFMDNVLMQLEPVRDQGMMFGPLDGDRKAPQVATRDIAAVAARLLADRSWSGHEDVPVLGPEDLSANDMARIASEALGKPVRYQQVPFEALEAPFRDQGASPAFAEAFFTMMRAKNEGLDNAAPRTPETTTPTPFRQWCDEVLKPAVSGEADEDSN